MELRYKKLIVWQKSIELVKQIYTIISSFPKNEQFALCDQMKRAAVSIPSNIAEGSFRNTQKESINFLHISLGSAAELETQVTISYELRYISIETYKQLENEITEIIKMLSALISVKRKSQL